MACAAIGQLGRLSPACDLIDGFAPFWGAGGAIAGSIALVLAPRWWRAWLVAGLLVLIGCAAAMMGGEAAARLGATSAVDGRPLRLVQFNAFKDNRDPGRALRWIARERPDIVTIEEGLVRARPIVTGLARLYPYQVSCLSRMRCSTVILSRVAPLASGGLAHGDPENRKTISAAWATFPSPGGPFTIAAVHMVRPWPWGDQADARREVALFIGLNDPRRMIVAGDFNLTPWTFAMREQDASFGIARLTRARPSWPAWPIAGHITPPLMPIDHIYAGQDFRLRALARGPWLGSDHYPLLATLVDIAPAPSRIARMKP